MSTDGLRKDIAIKKETVSIEFDILEQKDDKVRAMKYSSYIHYNLPATIKQINKSDTIIEVTQPIFVVYENFEINNLKGEAVDSLISSYDYSIVIDPETYEPYQNTIKLKPKEFSIDTINLANEFNFYLLKDPDTFLIRIKDYSFNQSRYSNWDTLIID